MKFIDRHTLLCVSNSTRVVLIERGNPVLAFSFVLTIHFVLLHSIVAFVLVFRASPTSRWDVGLIEDFHLGKTARSAGQKRTKSFKQALQAATIEAQKPIEMRMDWK